MADVLSQYRAGAAFDEMIDAEGGVRPSYKASTPRSPDPARPSSGTSPSRWPTTTPRPG